MIYLDYAKKVANGYILNFFADTEEDITEVSNGKHFITKNGTDYGIPQPSSTVVITMPDKTKKTYVLNEAGEWQLGGGETDYSRLTNVPIILANLADKDFIPEANTYYEHLGETTENFVKGIIYLYDGTEYKAIDGSGSDAGVQPDYNQNDSTAPDYIKNRPFYDAAVALFDETITTNMPEDVNLYVWETTSKTVDVNIGDEVKVIFNGVEYTQTAKDFEGYVIYVGNASLIELGEDTKEPFFITLNFAFYSSETQGKPITGIMVATKTAYNGEVKIITNGVKTIDPKFIKDMYYTKSESDVQKTLVFTGSINGLIEDFSSTFEAGNVIELKEDSIGLNVIDYAKKYTFSNGGTMIYIGNLYIFAELMPGENIVDTKEDYCLIFVPYHNNSSPQLLYANKNCKPPHNIEVYKSTDPIVRIPEKYLPLDVAKKSYVDTAISNAITKTLNTEV